MSQEIETIELNIKHAKKAVDLMKSVQRLTTNRDFKKVFLEGYFEQEAIRLVLLKSDPSLQGAEDQAALIKQMDAIGSVRQYLNTVNQLGRMAEKAISEDEATRDELLAEDL